MTISNGWLLRRLPVPVPVVAAAAACVKRGFCGVGARDERGEPLGVRISCGPVRCCCC